MVLPFAVVCGTQFAVSGPRASQEVYHEGFARYTSQTPAAMIRFAGNAAPQPNPEIAKRNTMAPASPRRLHHPGSSTSTPATHWPTAIAVTKTAVWRANGP